MKLFIDGDIILYRAGFAGERTKYTLTAPGIKTQEFMSKRELMEVVQGLELADYYVSKERIVEPVEHALSNTRNILQDIFASVPGYNIDRDTFQIYLTGSGNFRRTIDPEYKAHRDKTFKPHWTNEIQNYLVRYWDASIQNGHEADDAIAVGVMNENGDNYIVSSDKDFNQLPFTHKFNFVTREVRRTGRTDSVDSFLGQLVQGDASDNVKGIYGIGPKKWEKMVEDAKDDYVVLWKKVEELYANEYKENWKHRLVKNYYLLRLPRYWDEIPNEQDIQRIVSGKDVEERIENIKIQATDGLANQDDREPMPDVPREGMPEMPVGGHDAAIRQGEVRRVDWANPQGLQHQAMNILQMQGQAAVAAEAVNAVWGNALGFANNGGPLD